MHDPITSHGQLSVTANFGSVVEQLHLFPHLPPHLTYAPAYTYNETLARVQLGSTQFFTLRQINLVRDLGPGSQGEEVRNNERTGRQLERTQISQARPSRR